jgi:signal peptidase I
MMDATSPDNSPPPASEGLSPGTGSTSNTTAPPKHRLVIKLLLGFLALSIVAVVALKIFVVAVFFTPSVAMAPTLNVGDRFLVNRLAYRFGDIERGDIVVFKRPPGEPDTSIKVLVKRVVGLPGDEVSFKDGAVLVNGSALVEPYVAPGVRTEAKRSDVIKVPTGQVLVLGDNRTNSFDGRSFGTVDTSLIVGKLIYTLRTG